MIKTRCPQCSEALEFPLSLAGQLEPCPACKQILSIPLLDQKHQPVAKPKKRKATFAAVMLSLFGALGSGFGILAIVAGVFDINRRETSAAGNGELLSGFTMLMGGVLLLAAREALDYLRSMAERTGN